MNKLDELVKLMVDSCEEIIWKKKITVYGYQFDYQTIIRPSLSKYWFGEQKIEQWICPKDSESNHCNCPGTKKESMEYITIHDTASSKDSADEYAHARYVINGGGGTSWHYSVGSFSSCHQIPDDEVAYHAGDSLDVRFILTNTGIKGTNLNPLVEIKEGYYYINDQKSSIQAPAVSYEWNKNGDLVYASDGVKQQKKVPQSMKEGVASFQLKTQDINDAGIRIDLKEDGFYYIGPTYYNATYGKIANRGGNLNSIGIETMVNQGSNLMRTWHRCAKLVANLLVSHHLDVTRVKPHHFFSGKNCPQTLRENGLWKYFMDCVNVEYLILKKFSDIKIELVCQNEYIAKDGVFNQDIDINEENIEYQIKLTYKDEIRVIDCSSRIER